MSAAAFTPPNMVPIPRTTVHMRDARTNFSRDVDLLFFEIGQTAVTAAEFVTLMVDGAVSVEIDTTPAHPVTWYDAVQWCNCASARAGLRPAYDVREREVTWDVSADGFRLPTEAEWEAACRAGTSQPTYGPLHEIAWTAPDRVGGPQPVAHKNPNSYGMYDMLGNVWEWCWDFADTGRYGDYRSLRGGGWADQKWSVRASVRRGSAPDAVLEDVGFRVARGSVGPGHSHAAQGWSADADRHRANIRGPLPVGWTPHRALLD
ncbi:formylglycine-generating enzyme family protein [Klugiella xanthotipulae]|uniref:Formylglycine-generating enzyme required for sulfatase activity n=1 Tax=Klugiella xanthotipulae TaxID=244735 RepID=A0A543HXV8_9MICO|nr:SUMF1/EgtB/PvdO family nonheme iron enzyme [Klugiella xanthotipulae]TQM63065.1 formylglycine-generating enzyme required for sulfatase activity [Klugiella xanthotipulae]